MESANAQSLTRDWTRISNERDLKAEKSAVLALYRELTSLIPDTAEAGVAITDNTLEVHAIDKGVLLSVSAGEMSQSVHRYNIVARSLHADHVKITLRTEIYSDTPQTIRKRQWEFEVGKGEPIRIEGSEIIEGANFAREQHPDTSELTARSIARALGWQVPETAD